MTLFAEVLVTASQYTSFAANALRKKHVSVVTEVNNGADTGAAEVYNGLAVTNADEKNKMLCLCQQFLQIIRRYFSPHLFHEKNKINKNKGELL